MDEFLSAFGANLNGNGVKEAFVKAFEFHPEYMVEDPECMVEDGYEEVEKRCKSVVKMDSSKGKGKGKGKGKERGYSTSEMGGTSAFTENSVVMGDEGFRPTNQFGGTRTGSAIRGRTRVPVKEDIDPMIKVACYHLTAKAELEYPSLIDKIHHFLCWLGEYMEDAYDNPHVALANLPDKFQIALTKWSTVVAVCRDVRKRQDMEETRLILGCMALLSSAPKDDAAMGTQQ